MAPRLSLRKRLDALMEGLEPVLRDAFLASFNDIRSNVVLQKVVDALERKDINGAIAAMNIDRAAFAPLERAIEQAFAAGGTVTVAGMPALRDRKGAAVFFRFDVRNPRAERQIKAQAANLVKQIIDDQRQALRRAIEEGYALGQGPRTIALDVVGRINRATGKREGGVIGLTDKQTSYVTKARAQLTAGDGPSLRAYLGRERRDKRFDSTVMKAINSGEAIPADTVSKMVRQYESRLLQLRGETVARTETMQAVHASKHEAFSQGLAKTGYSEESVTRTWRSAGDGRVRHTHATMNGQTVRGLETPFESPSGALLRYPGDTSYGAGAAEIIGCRCDDEIDIDYSEGLR